MLLIILFAPLAAALLVLILPAMAGRLIRGLAILATGISAVGSCFLLFSVGRAPGSFQHYFQIPWLPQAGISLTLGADAISIPLIAISAVVSLAAILVSPAGILRPRQYYFLLLLLISSALAALSSLNLFAFIFFCEMATIPKYLLITNWGSLPAGEHGRTKEYAAIKQAIYINAGALIVLLAFIRLALIPDQLSFDLHVLQQCVIPVSLQKVLFGALLLGFGIWAAMWPFHTWAPLAYSAAPTAGSMLFAGVIKNLGAYGLIRFGLSLLPEGAQFWSGPMAILAVVNILYAGWVAMRQKDWNFVIAWSSVSHAGYLLLAVASMNLIGLTAAVLFMSAHGLTIALLFALIGFIYDQEGRRRLDDFSGLARQIPFVGTCTVMAVLAGVGLPGFANFWSEVLVFIGAWQKGTLVFKIATVGAVWGIVLTAVYMLRALRTSFYGPTDGRHASLHDATSLWRKLPYALLIIFLLVLGFWPRLITDPLRTERNNPVTITNNQHPITDNH